MDNTWTVFDGVTESREEFNNKFVPEIYLRPEVHIDVVENFRIIKKLIEHSYFEYKFYDVAALKSMLTMEMALKLRYKEITNNKWDQNARLYKLISWFEERNYFEVYNPDYLNSLRILRNMLAHPYEHGFSGPNSRPLIENIIDLVNGLYEDPGLREKRMTATLNMRTTLDSFKNGMKITGVENVYWSFKAWPGFINNKGNSIEIHFYYKPCYKIPEPYFENNQWTISPTLYFKANAMELMPGQILFKDDKNGKLLITEITDSEEQNEFKVWLEKYGKFSQPTGDYLFTNTGITDTFLLHLRAFHKI